MLRVLRSKPFLRTANQKIEALPPDCSLFLVEYAVSSTFKKQVQDSFVVEGSRLLSRANRSRTESPLLLSVGLATGAWVIDEAQFF